MKKLLLAVFAGALMLTSALQGANVRTERESGLYETEKDKEVVFVLTKKSKREWAKGSKLVCDLDVNGKITPAIKELDGEVWNKTDEWKVSVKPQQGWMLLHIKEVTVDAKGRVRKRNLGMAGALVNKDAIKAGTPEPADFDAFWKAEIEKMKKVPMLVYREEVEVTAKDCKGKVRAWRIKLDCGNGNFAYGYVAMPVGAKEKSLPCIIQYHGASTYEIRGPGLYYAKNSIHIVMSPHPIECGRDNEYYKNMRQELNGYAHRNADVSIDQYYMKGMVLRVVRSLEFAKTLPEWNGKDLLTHGESQGGFQAIVGAALDPQVSFCLAMVPAVSDHFGYKAGYKNGWPQTIKMNKEGQVADPVFVQKAEKVLPYVDNVNFAKRIKCEAWISTGLKDVVCPPTGVMAVFNNIPAKDKHMYIAPLAGHGAGNRDVVDRLHSIVVP